MARRQSQPFSRGGKNTRRKTAWNGFPGNSEIYPKTQRKTTEGAAGKRLPEWELRGGGASVVRGPWSVDRDVRSGRHFAPRSDRTRLTRALLDLTVKSREHKPLRVAVGSRSLRHPVRVPTGAIRRISSVVRSITGRPTPATSPNGRFPALGRSVSSFRPSAPSRDPVCPPPSRLRPQLGRLHTADGPHRAKATVPVALPVPLRSSASPQGAPRNPHDSTVQPPVSSLFPRRQLADPSRAVHAAQQLTQ